MLGGVGLRDTRASALGEPLRMPILVAPMAYQKLAHPEGEAAMARGAGAAGSLMCVSTMAKPLLEDVAKAATGRLWFQLYVYRDRAVTESLARGLSEAGSFGALARNG